METAAETWDPVVHFSDPREAWEFAHLLTYFFEAKHDPSFAKGDLLHDDPHYSGESKTVPEVVEELNPQEVFLRMIHPKPVPDEIRNLLDEDES